MKGQWPAKLSSRSAWPAGLRLFSAALDIVMPPHCPVTRKEVAGFGVLSGEAWRAAHFIAPPFCRRCGVPFAAPYGDEVECPSCLAKPPDFAHARAALVYDDATHKMIVAFKHGDRTELATMFARWMAQAGKDLIRRDTLLAPVPLHPSRLRARRFNQSALLAKALAAGTGARVSLDGLMRRRATPPQKDLSAEARRRNVSGAFAIRGDRARNEFRNRQVILIDDVLTTGATLSAAARALKRAGASQVDALVLARVVKDGVGAI